jgi:ubiquinone biosynthesis protein
MATIPNIHVPQVYGERSSTRVLTMEFIQGVKITDTAAIDQAGLDAKVVLQTALRAMVKQVLIDGFFHGDPHPGNVLLDPQTGVITFLDFGLVGELSQAQRFDLIDLLGSFVDGDTQSIATIALRFTQRHGPIDERAFRAEIDRLYCQYWAYREGMPAMSLIVGILRNVMSTYGLQLDSNLTLAIKAISQCENIALALQPELDWLPFALEEAKSQLGEQFTFERVVEDVKTQAVRSAKDLLRELPSLQDATAQWMDQFRRGRFVMELNTDDLADSVRHFSQSMRRVTLALILIGMLIGSALAASQWATLQQTEWALLPAAAMVIFVGSALLGMAAVLQMLQEERGDRP